mmetsp:Transcript_65253/g.172983  ORF Transcript_65253/g.172983 Transcript_65253/m.172983 type:complete len:254 (-) Transcript_65253:3146-3907(-)
MHDDTASHGPHDHGMALAPQREAARYPEPRHSRERPATRPAPHIPTLNPSVLLGEDQEILQFSVELLYAHHRTWTTSFGRSQVTGFRGRGPTELHLIQEHVSRLRTDGNRFGIVHRAQGSQALLVRADGERVGGRHRHVIQEIAAVPQLHHTVLSSSDENSTVVRRVDLDHGHTTLMRVLVQCRQEYTFRSPRVVTCRSVVILELVDGLSPPHPTSASRSSNARKPRDSRHDIRGSKGFIQIHVLVGTTVTRS